MSAALKPRVVRRDVLGERTRARMLELMQLCYDGVEPERFFSDLDNKDHVICLVDERGVLQGFSTIRMAEELLDGKRVDILFSGDTVIHPDRWGSKALQRGFLAFTVRHKLKHPRRPLYWLLLSKGYKTYLLLTNNFPTAFPRREHAAPEAVRALRDRVASAWWGAEYDSGTEILHFSEARDRVKNGVAPLDADALADPDIAYFQRKNPRWAEGDELVCCAEIDFGLGVRFTWKQLRRALRVGSLPRSRGAQSSTSSSS